MQVQFVGLLQGHGDEEWIGVELDEPKGKNDGACDGIYHFRCSLCFPPSRPLHRNA